MQLDSSDIPSIVPVVRNQAGASVADVQVKMDGELLTSQVDGQPVEVDPGLHELTFSTDRGAFASKRVLIVQGQRNRAISVSLHAPEKGGQRPTPAPSVAQGPVETKTASSNPAPPSSSARAAGEGVSPEAAREPIKRPKDRAACDAVYKSAKERESSGHLRDARDLLLTCATAACGKIAASACLTRFTELNSSDIPSVVPAVRDEAGAPRVDVQVRMDGELLASRLDGQPLSVDPGLHEFVFSTDSGVVAKENLTIAQGEHDRPIAIVLNAPARVGATGKSPKDQPASVESSPSQPVPDLASKEAGYDGPSPVPYLLVGGALAGAGAGAWLWSMRASSATTDTLSIVAETAVGLSVGVAVAAAGTVVWLLAASRSPEEKAPRRSAYVLQITPAPSGTLAAVSGSF